MSTGEVVIFSTRLREELERLGLSLAAAARVAGEKDSERLKQIAAARQRCPLELLAALAPAGVDVRYVITGERVAPLLPALKPDEAALLDNYRNTPEGKRSAIREVSAAFAQRGVRKTGND